MQTLKIVLSILVTLTATASIAKAQDVPIAPWSGRLILPTAQNRHSDGGVYIEIQNTPAAYASLKGKVAWVRFNLWDNSDTAQRFLRHTTDVTFNQTALVNKDNLALPTRLNGWKKVSPLESMAGAHKNDDVTVELLQPKITMSGGTPTIEIAQDPVILDGTVEAFVQFVREIDKEHHVVRYFNPQTGHFDGRTEVITLNFQTNIDDKAESEGLVGIETHLENGFGWNIFGDRMNGVFSLKAIEPHRLALVETNSIAGTYKNISDLVQDYWRIDASTQNQIRKTSLPLQIQQAPKLGDKFLVVHAFGAWNNEGEFFGYREGHAALGQATIVRHPISGELMADIVYTQVYSHSNRGIVAGPSHAHAYQGDLYRGRMFYRPINDALVSWPASFTQPVQIAGHQTTLSDELLNDLNDMSRDYRVGFGHGITQITVLSSCAHDSGNTLIKLLAKGHAAFTALGNSNAIAEIDAIAKAMGPEVEGPPSYRNADLIPPNMEMRADTQALVKQNMIIVVPRNFQDATVKAFGSAADAKAYALLTVQVASDMPGDVPHAPDIITMNKIIFQLMKGKLGL